MPDDKKDENLQDTSPGEALGDSEQLADLSMYLELSADATYLPIAGHRQLTDGRKAAEPQSRY